MLCGEENADLIVHILSKVGVVKSSSYDVCTLSNLVSGRLNIY